MDFIKVVRKKREDVEAIKYTEEVAEELLKNSACIGGCHCMGYQKCTLNEVVCTIDNRVGVKNILYIETANGQLKAQIGDWVIKNSKGGVSIYSHKDFLETYEII